MSDSKRLPLFRRLVLGLRPSPGSEETTAAPPPAAAPSAPTQPAPSRLLGLASPASVVLPREVLQASASAEWVSALPPGEGQGWVALLDVELLQRAGQGSGTPLGVCTLAQVTSVTPPASGSGASRVALRGVARARVLGLAREAALIRAEVALVEPTLPEAPVLEALASELRALGKQALRARPAGPFYLSASTVDALREPEALADLLAAWCNPDLETRRRILEALDVEPRARLVLEVLGRRVGGPGAGDAQKR